MPKNILSFEESSALSEITTIGGGVGVDGIEAVELAVEGAGDARSVVEPEEAYSMLELVQESGQKNEGRRMIWGCRREERCYRKALAWASTIVVDMCTAGVCWAMGGRRRLTRELCS
jgi:hypothetical protein